MRQKGRQGVVETEERKIYFSFEEDSAMFSCRALFSVTGTVFEQISQKLVKTPKLEIVQY